MTRSRLQDERQSSSSQPRSNPYYTDAWVEHGPNVHGLGWSSESAQQTRFDVICAAIDTSASVLDIGCGFGDLSARVRGDYVGLDAMEPFIIEALRRYPDRTFVVGDALDTPLPQASHVVASGLMTTHDGAGIAALLDRMWSLAMRSVVFNLWDPNLTPGQLATVAAGVVSSVGCQKWSVRSDYLPHDITVVLHKEGHDQT